MGRGNLNLRPPEGNQNAFRGLLFNDRLRTVLNSNNRQKLVQMVDELVGLACAGDLKAIEMIMDRVDGKATQSIDVRSTRTGELEGLSTLELQAEIVKRAYLLTAQPAVLEPVQAVESLPAVDQAGVSGEEEGT